MRENLKGKGYQLKRSLLWREHRSLTLSPERIDKKIVTLKWKVCTGIQQCKLLPFEFKNVTWLSFGIWPCLFSIGFFMFRALQTIARRYTPAVSKLQIRGFSNLENYSIYDVLSIRIALMELERGRHLLWGAGRRGIPDQWRLLSRRSPRISRSCLAMGCKYNGGPYSRITEGGNTLQSSYK